MLRQKPLIPRYMPWHTGFLFSNHSNVYGGVPPEGVATKVNEPVPFSVVMLGRVSPWWVILTVNTEFTTTWPVVELLDSLRPSVAVTEKLHPLVVDVGV